MKQSFYTRDAIPDWNVVAHEVREAAEPLLAHVLANRPGYDQGEVEAWVSAWTDLHQHFIDDWIIPIAGQPAPFTMPPNAGISGAGYEG